MWLDTEYFAQRIQCSRDDKHECLRTVRLLAEVSFTARNGGVKALDDLIHGNPIQFGGAFLGKAVQLYMDARDAEQIRATLYVCIIASNFTGRQFLNAVIITEAMAALFENESIDYIFSFLLPSYFGIDYEQAAVQVFQEYRKFRLMSESANEENK